MKIKKIIAAVCAAAAVLSLAGCDGTPSDGGFVDINSNSAGANSSVSAAKSTRSSVTSSSSKPISSPVDSPEEFIKTGKIKETILYDQGDIKITATKLTFNNYSAELEVEIENNTTTDLKFLSATLGYSSNSVNGYMVDEGYLNCDVAAGKKVNSTIYFKYDELRLLGINKIMNIELGLEIKAEDTFDDDFQRIYPEPRTIKVSSSGGSATSERTFFDAISDKAFQNEHYYEIDYISDKNVFNHSGLKVISEVVLTNQDGARSLFLEVENTGNEEVIVRTSDITLNGLTLYGWSYTYNIIRPKKSRVIVIPFDNILDSKCMDACGLEKLDSLGLEVSLLDSDNDELYSEAISVVGDASRATFSSDGEEIYNKGGVRIISKGLFDGGYSWLKYTYLVLLVENSTDDTRLFKSEYNSMSVNSFENSCFDVSHSIIPRGTQVVEIRLDQYDLEDCGIDDISDIKNIEFTATISNGNYHKLDSATVKATF